MLYKLRIYYVVGGMQDYNYVFAGCFEVSVMVGCCRYPPENETASLWEENQDSVINFIKQAHLGSHPTQLSQNCVSGNYYWKHDLGVKGVVLDESSNPIANVNITVKDREKHPLFTSNTGEFFRLLLPGDHVLKVEAIIRFCYSL